MRLEYIRCTILPYDFQSDGSLLLVGISNLNNGHTFKYDNNITSTLTLFMFTRTVEYEPEPIFSPTL